MAHFAKIVEGIVTQVVVVNNEDTTSLNGVEDGAIGAAFCNSLLGGTWVQTSYNTRGGVNKVGGTTLRFNYAGIGFIYDTVRDAFYQQQPFLSWVLDEATCQWGAPVPYPDDGGDYRWDEDTLSWVEITPIP